MFENKEVPYDLRDSQMLYQPFLRKLHMEKHV